METKSIFKSKTFWVGVIAILIGIGQAISEQLTAGADLTIAGLMMIILRALTTTGIKL